MTDKGKYLSKYLMAAGAKALARHANRGLDTVMDGIVMGGTGSIPRVYGTPDRYALLRTPKRYQQYQGSRANKIKIIDTPGGSKMAVKRKGAVMSRSAGKFKRLKRRSKQPRLKKPKAVDYVKHGVENTLEAYKVQGTTTQSLFLGHATFIKQRFLRQAWQAVLKRVFARMGLYINDWNEAVKPFSTADYRMVITYSANQVISTDTLPMTSGITFNTILTWLVDVNARPWYLQSNSYYLNRLTIEAVNNPGGRYTCDIAINRCRIQYDIKSTLKMQNRTVNSTANQEADDVDNVPLYGKTYEFKGTGLYRPKHAATQIVETDGRYGYNAVDTIDYPEPIHDLYYDQCKRTGKIKLDPGEIKTSVLNHKGTMLLNSVCRLVGQQTGTVTGTYKVGRSRWFHIEKMIDTITNPAPPGVPNEALGINMGIEHNHRSRMVAKFYETYVNAPEFTRQLLP